MAYNEVLTTAIGRMVSDVAVRTTAQGRTLGTFRMVTQERRYDREANLWKDGERMFFSVACWGWTATNAQRSLTKGDPVVVSGRLSVREFETVPGDQRSMLELSARAVGPDLSACSAVVTRPARDEPVRDDAAKDDKDDKHDTARDQPVDGGPPDQQPLPLTVPTAA